MSLIEVILQYLVIFCFGAPLVIFGLYGSVLIYYNKFGKVEKEKNVYPEKITQFEPFVSIVVPTHNEESIILKKIENLLSLDYPKEKLEIIFVDDSNDSTPKTIANFAKEIPFLHLLRFEERMGYTPSMVAGVKSANGEIIILGDAASFLDAQAIRHFVVHFQNSRIGAVSGKEMLMNPDESVGKSESLYQKIFNFQRVAESNMDSAFFQRGEACAVRSCLIKDLENISGSFDATVGLYVREKGFKSIFDPQVKFYEYAPLTHMDEIKQKSIRAAHLIRVILRFRHLMFKRGYGKFGFVILPMNFTMVIIAPLLIVAGLSLLIPLTFLNLPFSVIVWAVIGLFLLSSFLFSRYLLRTFIDLEYSILKALFELIILRKKTHDKIEKVDSTRRFQ